VKCSQINLTCFYDRIWIFISTSIA
jgi:hypothetical protein